MALMSAILASPVAVIVPALIASVAVQFVASHETTNLANLLNSVVSLIVSIINGVFFASILKPTLTVVQSAYAMLGVPSLPPDIWQHVPMPVIVLVIVLTRDFTDYWNHRFMHLGWIFPVHAAHHSDTHVNGLTTFRIHAFESFVMGASYILLNSWLGTPAMPVAGVWFLLTLHNCYVHLDLDWTHGPFKYVLASPRFHRWHHADVPIAYGKNLANVFPIFDLLFGTYIDPGPCRQTLGAMSQDIPSTNVIKLLIWPFIGWGRLITGLAYPRRL